MESCGEYVHRRDEGDGANVETCTVTRAIRKRFSNDHFHNFPILPAYMPTGGPVVLLVPHALIGFARRSA